MGDPQHRMLVRGESDFDSSAPREAGLTPADARDRPRFGVDVFVVPSLLLLIARDLLVRDPPRILAWRWLHDPHLSALSGGPGALLPRLPPDIDRDPIALVLATVAALLAAAYLIGGLLGRGPRFRAGLIVVSALVLVLAPAAGFMAMGYATGRPYGQDGGVVQLPLALDKILAGESPYAADYSDSILGKEARVSKFWATRGGNPILRHHAYLPGTHLLTMPFHLAFRAGGLPFDPRVVTLAAYLVAAFLASRIVSGAAARLCAAAVVLLNPLLYWQQIFGANDVLFVAMVLGTVALWQRGRMISGAALLGLACATKQLAWPFAPFLLLAASGARWPLTSDWRPAGWRFLRLALVAGVVFVAVVLPVAALDLRAFYADIVGYNVGLPGADNYPLGGTPGFGFANFLIYFGAVRSLGDYFPFGVFYLLLVPFGLLLVRATLRRGGETQHALVMGAAALVASLYFSRVVHPNYLIPVAVLLPIAALGATVAADVIVVPLLLLFAAAEIAEQAPLQRLWEDAVAVRLPVHASGPWAALFPRGSVDLTDDPLSLAWSAVAAGLGLVYLALGVLGVHARLRAILAVAAIVLVAVVPAHVVIAIGQRTGIARAQDEWVPEVRAASDALVGASRERPWAREGWSTSFREEPPRRLEAERVPAPAGAAVLSTLVRPLGADPRVVSIVAALAFAWVVSRGGSASQTPLRLAILLVPASLTTLAFGGDHVLVAAALVIALAASARLRAALRALAVGVAAASSVIAWPVAAILTGREAMRSVPRAALVGLATGLAATVAVLALADLPNVRLAGAGPGFGLANVGRYFGVAPLRTAWLWWGAALFLAGVAARRLPAPTTLAAAGACMVTLVFSPSASPDAVLVPLALLISAAADAIPAEGPDAE